MLGQYSDQICRNHLQSMHSADKLEPKDLFSRCQTFNTNSEDSQHKFLEDPRILQQSSLSTFNCDWEGFHPKKDP